MLIEKSQNSFLFGANAPYVEEQYEFYLTDPASVTEEWRGYFDALRETPAIDGSDRHDEPHSPVVSSFIELARRPRSVSTSFDGALALARKQVAVQSLVAAFRTVGTRSANLDPLRWTPQRSLPELTTAWYGLTSADMSTRFSTAETGFFDEDATLQEIVTALEETYTGTLGAEFMHLTDTNERRWWQMRLESTRAKPSFSATHKRRFLEGLTAAEGLEKHLHTRYVGQKRFSLEGGESLIVLLDELVRYGASKAVRSVVMGMAHRGRLNVLVNVAGKPLHALLDEFDGKNVEALPEGDVKYHKGYSTIAQTADGPVDVALAFNPSHLEVVNPVVQGMARAKADALAPDDQGSVLPVEIHGDAAMSGQGVVMETLSLSYTRGHGTGGTVHVVVNNQIGFTTSDPRDTRSSFYATDIVKMIEAPVLHVNGDDPEAVAMAVHLALDYRTEFGRSVVIDLVCFRKHGHQEQDTPAITQPLMYRAIAAHPGARTLYAQRLIELTAQREPEHIHYDAPSPERLSVLARRISSVPDGYALHPLAFNHRHATPHNQKRTTRSDGMFIPLEHVGEKQGRFTVTNSILSEAAVLAFEYGYSTVNRNALVIWEAQFGDFANGAQVVIDQFIAAAGAKWGQQSTLTLFLPHGQEGQGPEHASARLERYLQLSAQDNMRVTQPTTPAQLFHLLHRQVSSSDRRPLIVMTPKSLLRHPEAVSPVTDLSRGAFQEILPEGEQITRAERVIVTSGKVYFDLLDYRRKHGIEATPIIRVEQLYPFPAQQLAAELARYPNLKSVAWCQEEARNQGAWSFVEPQLRELAPAPATLSYAGPSASASTAPGYHAVHAARHAEVIARAFAT